MRLRPYQQQAVDETMTAFREYQSALIVQPTGCHAKGSPILLKDGTIKPVEDIRVGDVLAAPNDESRTVLQLARGRGVMYRIRQVKGEPFVVNEDHILTLIRTNDRTGRGGEIIDVSVRDWLTWPKSRKHLYKLFREPVDHFSTGLRGKPAIPPYIIGVLLGDGSLVHALGVTTADSEVVNELRHFAGSIGSRLKPIPAGGASWTYLFQGDAGRPVGCRGSDLHQSLVFCGLRGKGCADKHVPWEYRIADRDSRLELLAGLMDSDGHATCGGYDYVSKSPSLAHDVAFVARSVGLAAYVKPCLKSSQLGTTGEYYRVSISGHCDRIPCRIPRKRHEPRRQKKDALRTGFHVERVGIDDYYGFSLDGDGRFLMGDFTVTHNTGKTVTFARIAAEHRARSAGRVMVIAHREELVFQAAQKLKAVAGLPADIEMADMRAGTGMLNKLPAVVSSVQTLNAGCDGDGRMTSFDPDEFSLLVIDEAHHAVAPSYRRVIEYFSQNAKLKVLGVRPRLTARMKRRWVRYSRPSALTMSCLTPSLTVGWYPSSSGW